jgi:hypothetical protein
VHKRWIKQTIDDAKSGHKHVTLQKMQSHKGNMKQFLQQRLKQLALVKQYPELGNKSQKSIFNLTLFRIKNLELYQNG